jgi:hypothetical protein
MRLEISNLSDKATIDCSDRVAACLAVVVLSGGAYGIIDDDGNNGMPIFLFGGHDEWFQKEFGNTFKETLKEVGNNRIADALDTVQLVYERTSLNDFTKTAHIMAEKLRAKNENN